MFVREPMDIDVKSMVQGTISTGNLVVTGRLVDASNATLYALATSDQLEIACIYKPIAGERPLWDFPEGTLAGREYAAYLVSQASGLNIVPFTTLREGPFGFGMVQEWIDIDPSVDLMELYSKDIPALRSIVLFDAIINNTDRKIGHLLPTSQGHIFGCDHGVTFHVDNKLRSVLWQWSGASLHESEILLLQGLRSSLKNELGLVLGEHISQGELRALDARIEALLLKQVLPIPTDDWPSVPWPPF